MSKIYFQEISSNQPITIFGHTFQNAQEILASVNSSVNLKYVKILGEIEIFRSRKALPDIGVYIVNIYHPYPCFDSYDSCEDRHYNNLYFSRRPLTDQQIERLASQPILKYNEQQIGEGMTGEILPAIYIDGDHPTMTLASDRPYRLQTRNPRQVPTLSPRQHVLKRIWWKIMDFLLPLRH